MREIIITKNEAEQRVDRYLMKYLNNTSRGNIYKMLRKKIIKVNGKKVSEEYFLKVDDVLNIYISEETLAPLMKEYEIVPLEEFDIEVVYEDEDLLVVNKPKGLLTHPDKTEYKNALSTKVIGYLHNNVTKTFKPAPIHRLDKNTSGIVMFGKTYEGLKKYNEIMRDHDVEKYYQCIVHGHVEKDCDIEGYLIKDEAKNKVKFVEKDSDKSKYVLTKVKIVKHFDNFTLLDIQLMTGRSHQIRISLAEIGHPIVGDIKYGGMKVRGNSSQLLHCSKMVVEGKSFEAKSREISKFIEGK